MAETFKLEFAPANDRGFLRADFKDYNDESCSIQQSSIAARVCRGEIDQQQCIWLGQNEGTHHMGRCMARMHLTRDMARELAVTLMRFAETGELIDAAA